MGTVIKVFTARRLEQRSHEPPKLISHWCPVEKTHLSVQAGEQCSWCGAPMPFDAEPRDVALAYLSGAL